MSGQSARVSVEFSPIPTHPPSRPDAPAEDSGLPPHRLVGPSATRCSCGRAREACVRAAVRAVWAAQTPSDQGGDDLPGRHPGDAGTRGAATARSIRQDAGSAGSLAT
jgi:hypothetical protein